MAYQSMFEQLNDINQRAGFNGALAIVTPEKTLYQQTTGWANFEAQVPFTAQTVSAIGSVTKQFTASAILLLAENNQVDLDSPLVAYFPDYVSADKVTIRQLLNMDSGIPDYIDIIVDQITANAKRKGLNEDDTNTAIYRGIGVDVSIDHVLQLINSRPMDFKPGARFAYCNTNYAILSRVIEIISGTTYERFIGSHILSPLGLTHTQVGTDHSQADSYLKQTGGLVNLGKGNHHLGDGCLVTNLDDFKLWAQTILNGDLLTAPSWQTCFTFQHDMYGMGWLKDGNWLWHTGKVLDFISRIYVSNDLKLALVWLYNVDPADGHNAAWKKEVADWRDRFLSQYQH